MKINKKKVVSLLLSAVPAIALSAVPAFAQEAATEVPAASDTSVFVFNTLLFLISGMVVMFMAAGFSMLEVGLVS